MRGLLVLETVVPLLAASAVDIVIALRLRYEAYGRQEPVGGPHDRADGEVVDLIKEVRERGAQWLDRTKHDLWTVRTPDNIKLVGYWIARSDADGKCVLLVHGQRASAKDLGELGREYHARGFNVLLVDSRAHGASEGNYSTLGWLEREDCKLWIERIIEVAGNRAFMVLHGLSMGANALLNAAGDGLPTQVKAIVADSAYTSARSILSYRIHRRHIPATPVLLMAYIVGLVAGRRPIFGADTRRQVARSTIPTLFIHSKRDQQNPPRMSVELYANASSVKELWLTDAPFHGMTAFTMTTAYMARVEAFLEEIKSA